MPYSLTESAGYGIGWNHSRAKTLAFSACHWLLVYLDYRLESGGSIKVCLTGCPRKWRCVWLGLQREWPTGSGKQHQPTDPVSGDYSSRSCHKENRLWIRSHHGRATELTIFQSEYHIEVSLILNSLWAPPHLTPVVKLINCFSPELPSRPIDGTVKFIFNRETWFCYYFATSSGQKGECRRSLYPPSKLFISYPIL